MSSDSKTTQLADRLQIQPRATRVNSNSENHESDLDSKQLNRIEFTCAVAKTAERNYLCGAEPTPPVGVTHESKRKKPGSCPAYAKANPAAAAISPSP